MKILGAVAFTAMLTSMLISDHHSLIFPTEAEVQQAIKDLREAGLMSPSPLSVAPDTSAN